MQAVYPEMDIIDDLFDSDLSYTTYIDDAYHADLNKLGEKYNIPIYDEWIKGKLFKCFKRFSGWWQGQFNGISSIKHNLAYGLAVFLLTSWIVHI
mmetsp:Transcript_19058/g.8867  ORF Transcript_19058/g.8867 Transcript_19058/m.8867 type:complete len:95 (+) Transcript_19058:280-564(+)